jgi:hypothetical protein
VAVLRSQIGTGFGKGWRDATAVVGQHVGETEGKGRSGFTQKSDGAAFGLVVLDGQVDAT